MIRKAGRRWFLLTGMLDFSMEFVIAAQFMFVRYKFSFRWAMGGGVR
jgi:hypothetical protein